ncbi:NAC domain-containing protein 92-like [Triticum aestivum]|uniref:NAC domain-containing protein 92-like n=1 Tax=Triticum aestivum TaxID=4565 RepID=UPI001D024A1B|nr:NAC domain-containing protein 92-like [Triticum aestivum]
MEIIIFYLVPKVLKKAFDTTMVREVDMKKYELWNLPNEKKQQLNLPPGFGFHPTNMEIIIFYLVPKVQKKAFDTTMVREEDMKKYDLWNLPNEVNMGEKERYSFS